MVAGLARNQKRRAFGRQRVSICFSLQKLETHQGIQQSFHSAHRTLGLTRQFLHALGRFFQKIEQTQLYGAIQNKRRRKSPGTLHQPLGRWLPTRLAALPSAWEAALSHSLL